MVDLVHLKSFAEVAERGTVAAAAAAQGYTAPAVSQHVAKLEGVLDVKLFDRLRGRLVLTSAGEALLPIAFEMLDLDSRATVVVGQGKDLPHVVVSGFATAISTVLVPLLSPTPSPGNCGDRRGGRLRGTPEPRARRCRHRPHAGVRGSPRRTQQPVHVHAIGARSADTGPSAGHGAVDDGRPAPGRTMDPQREDHPVCARHGGDPVRSGHHPDHRWHRRRQRGASRPGRRRSGGHGDALACSTGGTTS